MRIFTCLLTLLLVLQFSPCHAGFFGKIFKRGTTAITGPGANVDQKKAGAGLREALSVSAEKGINLLAKPDGYLKNQAVKIIMPDELEETGKILRKFGLGRMVDNFEESMNRAAENAAPKAKDILTDAIKDVTFKDTIKILNGGDTAATDYFKGKTSDKIYNSFKPIITDSMNVVGVTRYYKAMTGKLRVLSPLTKLRPPDLDDFVTHKALDGLFYTIGQEETKIRTDPLARTTELLKDVFGRAAE